MLILEKSSIVGENPYANIQKFHENLIFLELGYIYLKNVKKCHISKPFLYICEKNEHLVKLLSTFRLTRD